MSAKTIVFWVAFAAAAGISYFSSVLAGPKANMAVLLMPVMALIWRVYWKEKGTMAVTVVSAAVSLAMWVPLGAASHGIAVAAVILSALVYFLTIPFCIHLDRLNETGDNIKKRREELSRMKNEGINTLNEAYNQADREIKEITSIYTAVKELSATMTLDSSLSTISEILKKVIKSNFKIQIEEISFVIIFKREFDYYVAESYGYDEETIKQAEKQIVASVLRNVSKSQDIVYSRTMEGSGSLS
ncbi:MAG TPA: hypothetical protein P5511_06965, partial [Candidatus Goldiibacteriota bacterium]|nr:hypothetical protein [Candidatus Goldiibacteriota bacterium]